MKKRQPIILIIILFSMTTSSFGQLKNPGNLEFTWKTDTTKHGVELSEITIVLPKGSFPRIDYPVFLGKKAGLESFYAHEPVISVAIGEKAKAYPLNMLTIHEISNDKLGGIPILATYCPLCNAGVVYDRRVDVNGKKKVLEFEVSGMLRKSDMAPITMWDMMLQKENN